MVLFCIVPKCCSKYIPGVRLTFHRFPKEETLRDKWVFAIQKHDPSQPVVVKSDSRVCGEHFDGTDFRCSGSRKSLKKNSLPKMFSNSKRTAIMDSVNDQENIPPDTIESHEVCKDKENTTIQNLHQQVSKLIKALATLENDRQYLLETNERLTVQQKMRNVYTVQNFEKNDSRILFYTGIQTYAIFISVFEYVLPTGSVDDLKLFTKSPKKLKAHSCSLSAKDQFFLVLIKMRLNLGHIALSDMFGLSPTSVSCIFKCWINLMFLRLGSLEIWPHRDIIFKNAPAEFVEQYPNVIGSIDCVEFFIQTPSSMKTQSQCYSHYKGATTMKSLVMTDPNGAFIYVSPLFTGSISDKDICIKSGFVDIVKKKVENGELRRGDVILADKGFNVSSLFGDININIPVFRVNGTQFSPEEVNTTRIIARERVHVKRGIGRLKSFKLLASEIPATLFTSIEQIYAVCCILCNCRYPLREKKTNIENC